MRIYKLPKCSETESDKLIWKHLCSSPDLCQHHLDNYKRAWFKGLLWCVLICLFQNESRRLNFFTCCTEDFRWIMCYLLPVASEEAEQNAGISSRSSETILAAELWWNSAHNQDHVCCFFFFTGLNFTFRYLSCYCGIWNAPAIFSFQCFGKHSVSQPN